MGPGGDGGSLVAAPRRMSGSGGLRTVGSCHPEEVSRHCGVCERDRSSLYEHGSLRALVLLSVPTLAKATTSGQSMIDVCRIAAAPEDWIGAEV